MTKKHYMVGCKRHLGLLGRQQAFLRVLVDCAGSRARAIAACGVPPGTVFRWQSDPWFRERYEEIRHTLAGGEEALRESLSSAAFAMAIGEYGGSLKPAAVRRSLDLIGFSPGPLGMTGAPLPSLEEIEAEIRELFGEG